MSMPRLHEQLKDAAGAPGPPLDYGAVLDRARRLRRRRTVGGGGAMMLLLCVLVGAAWLVALRGTVDVASDVLLVPPPGEALGQFLGDGTPVWVTRSSGGEVFVLEARHPDTEPSGMHASASHVVLCNEPMLESRWGSRFSPDGTAMAGPTPHGLRRYEVVSIDEWQVEVGAVFPDPQPLDTGAPTQWRLWCPRDAPIATHPAWADTFERWYEQWYGDTTKPTVDLAP